MAILIWRNNKCNNIVWIQFILFSDILKVPSPVPAGRAAERKIHVVYTVVILLPKLEPAGVIGAVGRKQTEELLN